MTKPQAQMQLEAFFLRLGQKASFFDDKNFVKARVGEAVLGFEFEEETLSAKALVYRFRREPGENVLRAIESAGQTEDTGGGRVVFEPQELTIYLQRDFHEPIPDSEFYDQINQLALASLKWSSDVLENIAEETSAY